MLLNNEWVNNEIKEEILKSFWKQMNMNTLGSNTYGAQ